MKLRAKLLTFFLLATIIPLIFATFFTYQNAQNIVVSDVTVNLERTAFTQKQRVKDVVSQYLDNTGQITSQLKLRENTALYAKSPDLKTQESITAILIEAKKAMAGIIVISVLDTKGNVIASTNKELVGQNFAQEPFFTLGQKASYLHETFKDDVNILNVRLVGPLIFKGELVGVAEVVERADKLIAITEDFTGLGNTGESFIAKADTQRNAIFLTPLRFNSNATLTKTTIGDPVNVPIIAAISGRETVFTGNGIFDYRGKEVFAATQFIESLNWAIIAKIDRDEALGPIIILRNTFFIIFLFSFLFVAVLSFFVSKRITSPIIKLAGFADQLAKADFTTTTTTTTIDVYSKDEVGILARSFTTMAQQLKSFYASLEQKVKERTKELEHANIKLQSLDKLKDEFLSIASHELRTPLTAIDGLVSMILDKEYGPINKNLEQPLKDVNTSSERLIHLVNDLLNLSRIQAGRMKYTLSDFSIAGVITETVHLLKPLFEQKRLQLRTTKLEPIVVQGDVDKIKEVLNNLIGNSLKFTDKGDITVSTKVVDDKVEVQVSDTGIGISKEDQSKLFGQFEQLESGKGRPAGTGLGLHISKKMTQKMGGELWIEKSEKGMGSTFSFSVPKAKTALAQKIKKEIEAESTANPDQKSDTTQ